MQGWRAQLGSGMRGTVEQPDEADRRPASDGGARSLSGVFDGHREDSSMTHIILDKRRRASAGVLGTLVILGQTIGFGILPMISVLHPGFTSALEWLLMGILGVASLVAFWIAMWRIFGREFVVLDTGVIHVHYTAGFISRSLSLPLSKGTDVRVMPPGRSEIPNDVFGVGHRSVLVRNASGQLRCGMTLATQEAESLADRIREASGA